MCLHFCTASSSSFFSAVRWRLIAAACLHPPVKELSSPVGCSTVDSAQLSNACILARALVTPAALRPSRDGPDAAVRLPCRANVALAGMVLSRGGWLPSYGLAVGGGVGLWERPPPTLLCALTAAA